MFTAVGLGSRAAGAVPGGFREITTEADLRPFGKLWEVPTVERPDSREVIVDFGRSRVAVIWAKPGSSIGWAVETAGAVALGVRTSVQCGGAQQVPAAIGAVLPRSQKPVRVTLCTVGSCPGGMKAP